MTDANRERRKSFVLPAVGVAFFLLSLVTLVERGDRAGYSLGLFHGDAAGHYAFLPSLLFDGDLNVSNQRGPPWMTSPDRPGVNRYPVGLALTHLPAFLVGHAAATLLPGVEADGYSWPYQVAAAANAALLLTLAGWVVARVAQERFGVTRAAAVGGVLLWWLGTHVAYYAQRDPLSAHLAGIAWASLLVGCAHRLLDAASGRARLAWVSLSIACLTMAAATRYTNALFALVPLTAAWHVWRSPRPAGEGAPRAAVIAAVAAGVLTVAVVSAAQVAAWNAAPPVADAQGVARLGYESHEGFEWTRPALVRVLLSSRGGLLFWSPGLILALAFAWTRRRDPVVRGLLLTAAALWYVNAAWWAYWFGPFFGNRAFLELAPLYALGFAAMFGRLADRPRLRWAIAIVVVAANVALLALHRLGVSEPGQYLIPAERRLDEAGWRRF